jgi:exodeoxyribonuclease VII large subunit
MAIFESKIPIIAAIGHETDNTLSDFISDLRAPTPTAAAELATPNIIDLKSLVKQSKEDIRYQFNDIIRTKQKELMFLDQRLETLSPTHQLKLLEKSHDALRKDLMKHFTWYLEDKRNQIKAYHNSLKSPSDKISSYQEKHNHLYTSLQKQMHTYLTGRIHDHQILNQMMLALNPLKVMDKGFALIKKDDQIITTIHDVDIKDQLTITLKDGRLTTIIQEKEVK